MKIEQLTFTRFIAAIAIVIFHYGQDIFLFNNEYVSFIFKQANVGVSYFFMLSGFVMIIAYENQNINFFQYYSNRLARIYPLYAFTALLICLNSPKNINVSDLILHLSMFQTWIPGKAFVINYPGWSLSVELFFYLTFPLLANKLYSKLSLRTNTIWILLFWLFSQIISHLLTYKILTIHNFELKTINTYPLLHLNEFLIGNLAGLYFIKKIKNQQKNYSIHIITLVLFLILALNFSSKFNLHNGLLALFFIPLIILISLSSDKLTIFFKKKVFVLLGEISFSIYLLQFPVWSILTDFRLQKYLHIDTEADFTIAFSVRLLVLIIASILSYFFLEIPIKNLIKKLLNRTYLKPVAIK